MMVLLPEIDSNSNSDRKVFAAGRNFRRRLNLKSSIFSAFVYDWPDRQIVWDCVLGYIQSDVNLAIIVNQQAGLLAVGDVSKPEADLRVNWCEADLGAQ